MFKYVLFLILCAAGHGFASQVTVDDGGVVQISDTMYVGRSTVPYVSDTGNVVTTGDQVYFVCEQLSLSNVNKWQNYVDIQEKLNTPNGVLVDKGTFPSISQAYVQGFSDGYTRLQNTLNVFKMNYPGEIWISFATRENPLQIMAGNLNDAQSFLSQPSPAQSPIEIAFSIFLDRSTPVVTHIGLTRNGEYFRYSRHPHKNISMTLQGFAAQVEKMIPGPDRYYMITKPSLEMGGLIKNAFVNNNLLDKIWVGNSDDRDKAVNVALISVRDINLLKELPYYMYAPFETLMRVIELFGSSNQNTKAAWISTLTAWNKDFNQYYMDNCNSDSLGDFIEKIKNASDELPAWMNQINVLQGYMRYADYFANNESVVDARWRNGFQTLFNQMMILWVQSEVRKDLMILFQYYKTIYLDASKEKFDAAILLKPQSLPFDISNTPRWSMVVPSTTVTQEFTRPLWFDCEKVGGDLMASPDDSLEITVDLFALASFWRN